MAFFNLYNTKIKAVAATVPDDVEYTTDYNELFGEKTSIFRTQRLISTVFFYIFVYLEDGKIIEIGSHKELMEKKGKYAEMFELQRKMYVEKEG